MKENGTRVGRSLQVLPCSCLLHVVLEQSNRSFLISLGPPARLPESPLLLEFFVSSLPALEGYRSRWKPCLCGLLLGVEGHETW